MSIEDLLSTIQDCHLNFLIGSGLSMPYLSTLGNIEKWLTELDTNSKLSSQEKEIIRASILYKYFESVILKNRNIIDSSLRSPEVEETLSNYKHFLSALNLILLKRKSTILNKQINIFTTNIDVFFEKALEETQLEFNDGFSGRINPVFSLTNFKKSFFKNSMQYDNISELPVFNLLKVHGSLSWLSAKEKILYSNLDYLSNIESKWSAIKSKVMKCDDKLKFKYFEDNVKKITHDKLFTDFLTTYENLAIINPTKEKFKDTILNLNYYELLRLFSNELEKENTLLFILGFSVADEHIREILLRAANSNPTLLILIYSYDSKALLDIESNIKKGNVELKYNNIKLIEPKGGSTYDFKTINLQIFDALIKEIEKL